MSSQKMMSEIENMGEKLLAKLKDLPQAEPVQIVSFTIILIFIGIIVLMTVIVCCYCCWSSKKRRVVKVQPKQDVMGEETLQPMHSTAPMLEDIKNRILGDDWALGGLVVIGSFCLLFLALLLFATVFGCCPGQKHKSVYQ